MASLMETSDEKSADNVDQSSVLTQTIDLLNSIKNNAMLATESARQLLAQLEDQQLSTNDGISLLELKNKMLVSYLMDLTFLMIEKINGNRLEGNEVISRLVEERIVLERMRPIEHKLKYRIDQLMKTCATRTIDASDPLRMRPKLGAILGDNDSDVDSDGDRDVDSDESREKGSQRVKSESLYVAPKIAAVKYDFEEESKAKALERAKKRALSSSLIQELRQEFDDGPQEIRDSTHLSRSKVSKVINERTAYEEEFMTRVNLTKKERNETKKLMAMTALADGVTHFEDITALDVDNEGFSLPSKKKRSAKQKNANKYKRRKFNKSRK